MIVAFPGGDTGKRWHIMREVTQEDRDSWFWPQVGDLISICKTFHISEHSRNHQKEYPDRTWNDTILESDTFPIPSCAHCTRMLSK